MPKVELLLAKHKEFEAAAARMKGARRSIVKIRGVKQHLVEGATTGVIRWPFSIFQSGSMRAPLGCPEPHRSIRSKKISSMPNPVAKRLPAAAKQRGMRCGKARLVVQLGVCITAAGAPQGEGGR